MVFLWKRKMSSLFRRSNSDCVRGEITRNSSMLFFLGSNRQDEFIAEVNQEHTDPTEKDLQCQDRYEKLKLSTTSLGYEELDGIFSLQTKLKELRIIHSERPRGGDGIQSMPQSIKNLVCLEILDLRNNPFRRVPQPILSLVSLKRLHLSQCGLNCIPKEIWRLNQLKILSLDDNEIKEIPESLFTLSNLEELYLSKNKLRQVPESIKNLSELHRLDLSENALDTLPDGITELTLLTKFLAAVNYISALPENIGNMRSLKYLDMSQNFLLKIPSSIGNLKELRYIKLVENSLTGLPVEITELNVKPDAFLVADNKLQVPPQKVCEHGLDSIRGYFVAAGQDNGIHNMRLKLILLGESMAGKTSLAEALVKGADAQVKHDDRTIQMNFYKYKPRPLKDPLEILIVDCAGQRQYLLTHHFFLSKGCLYLIVVNLVNYDCSDDAFRIQVCDWIETVLSKVPDATILVAGTHRDRLDYETIQKRSHDIVNRIQALSDDLHQDRVTTGQRSRKGPFLTLITADCTKNARTCCSIPDNQCYLRFVALSSRERLEGLNMLRKELCRIADDQTLAPYVKCDLYPSWINFEEYIVSLREEEREHPVRERKQLLDYARDNFKLDESSSISALRYYNSIGTISYFDASEETNKFVIIDPSWFPCLLKDLFRHDLKESCTWNDEYHELDVSPTLFEQDMDQLVYKGKLKVELLRCIWHKFNINDVLLDFLVSLMQDFKLITPKNEDGTCLVPWFFEEALPESKLCKLWPLNCPDNKIQVRTRYEILSPYDIVSGIFDRFAVTYHCLHSHYHCYHWKSGLLLGTNDCDMYCRFERTGDQKKFIILSVEGRCSANRLKELWMELLVVHAIIMKYLKTYQGVRWSALSVCPNPDTCDYVFKANWFDSSFRMENFCNNDEQSWPLDYLRPPVDVLDEYLDPTNGIFSGELLTEEQYVVANAMGDRFRELGKAMGLGASVVTEMFNTYKEEPTECIIKLFSRAGTKNSRITRQKALTTLRHMDPVPTKVINDLIEKIQQASY